MENYGNELIRLENEQRALNSNLAAAVAAGNGSEITRLKGRERDLPGEIYSAKVLAKKMRLDALESRQTDNYQRLKTAKDKLLEIDKTIAAKMKVLDDARAELSRESLTALAQPQIIESEIRATSDQIAALKKELEQLINS